MPNKLHPHTRQPNGRRNSSLLALLLALLAGFTFHHAAQAQNGPTYWLPRSTGTEIVYDQQIPSAIGEILSASGPYAKWKYIPTFRTVTYDGVPYNFVTSGISWDRNGPDNGSVAYNRDGGLVQLDFWIDPPITNDAFKAYLPTLKQMAVNRNGWGHTTFKDVLIWDGAGAPTLRIPIPRLEQLKTEMNELSGQTVGGQFYPQVQIPADLAAYRDAMLEYGNLGRQDPDFRKKNGSTTATNLSLDRVPTLGKYSPEQVFRDNATPPYFDDHVLRDDLNAMAQFQAEYNAYIDRLTHDGPYAYFDPVSGKTVNMFDMGKNRAPFFGVSNVVEAAGQGGHGDYPHSWMKSETHFRPWFNVDGCYPEVGYGAAKSASGKWYFVAVPTRLNPCTVPTPTPAVPTATVIPATATAAAATATAVPATATAVPPTATPVPAVVEVTPAPAAVAFPIPAGNEIVQGEKYPSESGNHYLVWQPDGNVVVYDANDGFVWGLNLVSDRYPDVKSVLMQPDGNFAIYGDNGDYIWSALHVNPDASSYLHLTPEGVLQLVSGDARKVLWASDDNLNVDAPTPAPTATPTPEVIVDPAAPAPIDPAATIPAQGIEVAPVPDATEEPAEEATTEGTTAEATEVATEEATAPSEAVATPEVLAPNSPNLSSVADGDGNVYPTVKIGDQIWITQNLRTSVCSDGSPIPYIADADEWLTQTGPAYTWSSFVDDDAKKQAFGALYNDFAALASCNICPADFRVPSIADYAALLENLGGDAHLALSDPNFWGAGSLATNSSGFSARPGGGQGGDLAGSYDFGTYGYYWSTTESIPGMHSLMVISSDWAGAGGIAAPRYGFSMRCMQDSFALDPDPEVTPDAESTAAADATPEATPEATGPANNTPITVLGDPGPGATCLNIPAAATDGNVRLRLNNTGFGSQEAWLYYIGTTAAPAQPVVHTVVPSGQIVDIEAPVGTQWEIRSWNGIKVGGTLTATAEKPCQQVMKFRVGQSGYETRDFARGHETVCNDIPALPNALTTIRFYNAFGPRFSTEVRTVYMTDLSGDAPKAVEMAQLKPGEFKDLPSEPGVFWEIRSNNGNASTLLIASDAPTQCAKALPVAYRVSPFP